MKKIADFIRESKEELMKVNWPTKKQTMNYTMVIIGVSIAVALFLGGLDYVFSGILKKFI